MNIIKKGKFIYISEYSPKEKALLENILSVEEGYGKDTYTKTFLWKDRTTKQLYTYQGFLPLIVDRFREIFGIIITPKIEDKKAQISLKDIREKVGQVGHLKLRDYQLLAVAKGIQEKYGAIQVATGGGKSLIMASIIKYLDLPTLVITPTVQLAHQFYKVLLDLGFDEDDVSLLQGDKVVKKINVGVINTISSMITTNPKSLKDIKVVLYDEMHHKQATSYRKVDKFFDDKAEYNLGFTGSLFRTKDVTSKESVEDFISYGLSGKPLIDISMKFLMENKYITTPAIYIDADVFTNVKSDYWHTVLDTGIIKNERRNEKIAEWISFFSKKNMTVLTLVDRISHIHEIFSNIEDREIKENTIVILGNKKGMIYKGNRLEEIFIDYNDIIERIENKEFINVIGTTVLKEGTDMPTVDAVILGYVGKSIISVVQKIGRGLRKRDNKDYTYIIDFYDGSHRFLEKHSIGRLDFYKEQGFPIYTNKNKKDFIELVETELDKVSTQ